MQKSLEKIVRSSLAHRHECMSLRDIEYLEFLGIENPKIECMFCGADVTTMPDYEPFLNRLGEQSAACAKCVGEVNALGDGAKLGMQYGAARTIPESLFLESTDINEEDAEYVSE